MHITTYICLIYDFYGYKGEFYFSLLEVIPPTFSLKTFLIMIMMVWIRVYEQKRG